MSAMVLRADVVSAGEGALELSWDLAGGGPVEIALGRSPGSIDHDHPVALVDDGRALTLRGLGPGRHYVSVAPAGGGSGVIAAERRVPLEGTANFRDLGGYRTAGGGWTRWGLVFRSDAPHRLSAADVTAVTGLGLRVAYDLRMEPERSLAPSVLPSDIRCELVEMGGSAGKTKEITEMFVSGQVTHFPDDFLVRVYESLAELEATSFGRLLTGLAAPGGLPALIHCTAGKDRTGMTAALLLSVLGVDEATVLDDYELSAVYYTEREMARLQAQLADAGMDVENFRAVLGTPRDAMASVLAMLRERHGSIEGYLTGPAGMSPGAFAELRSALVERSARTAE